AHETDIPQGERPLADFKPRLARVVDTWKGEVAGAGGIHCERLERPVPELLRPLRLVVAHRRHPIAGPRKTTVLRLGSGRYRSFAFRFRIGTFRSSLAVTRRRNPARFAFAICARFSAVATPRRRQLRATAVRPWWASVPKLSIVA